MQQKFIETIEQAIYDLEKVGSYGENEGVDTCQYITPGGDKCIVGHMIKDELLAELSRPCSLSAGNLKIIGMVEESLAIKLDDEEQSLLLSLQEYFDEYARGRKPFRTMIEKLRKVLKNQNRAAKMQNIIAKIRNNQCEDNGDV